MNQLKANRSVRVLGLSLFLVIFLLGSDSLLAAKILLNGTLKVAYRQLERGKLSESLHHLTLRSCAKIT